MRRFFLSAFAFAMSCALFCSAHPATADDPAKDKPAAEAKDAAKPEAKEDEKSDFKAKPVAVPDGTADELLKFIREQMGKPPEGKSREEQFANYAEMQKAIVKAVDKLLATKEAADEKEGEMLTARAIMAKLQALEILKALGDETAEKQTTELLDKYSADKRTRVAALVSQIKLKQRFSLPSHSTPEQAKAMLADAKDYFSKNPIKPEYLQVLMRLGGEVEHATSSKEVADFYDFLAEQMGKSEDPRLAKLGKKFVGMARRMRLMGSPMEVFGKQLDGKEFDWKKYEGKVVLVDFWATWCGPCVAELPNVQKNYEAYHARGFDVIGISLDDNRQDVEKFLAEHKLPWPILFSDDANATGWEHPLAAHYGIMGIPTVILVDQKGNVVSLNARGPELGAQLAKLLGEPAKSEAPEKKEEGKEDKKEEK